MTDDFIIRLIVALLHLAYDARLGNTDTLLTRAQMRFIDELEQKDEP